MTPVTTPSAMLGTEQELDSLEFSKILHNLLNY